MPLFRWRVPPFPTCAAALGLTLLTLAAGPVRGQPSEALAASDPARIPAQALPWSPPPAVDTEPPRLPGDLAEAREAWRRANERVAEFPRGHLDLVQWEERSSGTRTDATAPSARPEPLDLDAALRMSLRHRPDLFTHAGMNEPERAAVRVAFAGHVRDLRHAWIDAVAAHQRQLLQEEVLDTAQTASQLGDRMVQAGNWSAARWTGERLVQATAWQATAQARADALEARERLARILGMWDAADAARLGERLPDRLAATPPRLQPPAGLDEASLEAAVLRSDPALARERLETQRAFDALGADRWQAWSGAVAASLQARPPSSGEPPHIDQLALLRDPRLQQAVKTESELLRRVAERRSQARLAWAKLQWSHARENHAQDVVARLHASLEQETLLRYNGMLQSTWELLASARERMRSLDDALRARQDFWRAEADWQALLGGAP